jgi:ribosome-associated translation inhibitor RaiA
MIFSAICKVDAELKKQLRRHAEKKTNLKAELKKKWRRDIM